MGFYLYIHQRQGQRTLSQIFLETSKDSLSPNVPVEDNYYKPETGVKDVFSHSENLGGLIIVTKKYDYSDHHPPFPRRDLSKSNSRPVVFLGPW